VPVPLATVTVPPQAGELASRPPVAAAEPILTVNNIEVVYSDVILVLHGVSLSVPDKEIVTLLGANGAGKSTTLKAISGLLKGEDGEITRGEIVFAGENLRMGAYSRRGAPPASDIDMVFHYFPRLKERAKGLAGYLSGGEQQMLAIGRALMAKPKLILMDEPSMGLSPLLVKEVFAIIETINREQKVPILLVEQNTNMALRHATYGYIMEGGKIVMDGPSAHLRGNEDVKEFYLGTAKGGERRSFKDLKSYKRRKRWL
jgi:branched-chain amino acid transport system ATP-binding protein